MKSALSDLSFQGVTGPLPHLGVIQASGADAAQFLHNQLTNDVLLMQSSQARLAAFCSAKGRMQASFVLCKPAQDVVLLVCRRDLLAQTLKRLSMFVLRAKVSLRDVTDEVSVHGLAGHAVSEAFGQAQASTAPWQHVDVNGAHVISLYPALNQPRALWLASKEVTVPSTLGPALPIDLWQLGEVMSGIAWIELATFEAFVPQMLNYESVDGVNFKKGCYPGQEVVARSQFRGTLKRRGFVVTSETAMVAGQEVFVSSDASQPCGTVAQAASAQGWHVGVVSLQLGALESGSLHLGRADGPTLNMQPLPYPLREDI